MTTQPRPNTDEIEYLKEDCRLKIEALKIIMDEVVEKNKALTIERDTFKTCIQIMSNNKGK
jgi:hypothetical protein